MDLTPHDPDFCLQQALNSWAEQGILPAARSKQLQDLILELARQDRRRRFIRMAYGLLASIFAYIILLFASCPVAAAARITEQAVPSTPFSCFFAWALLVFLLYMLFIQLFCLVSNNRGWEVGS